MKALNLHEINDLRFEDLPLPIPAKDEVLLKITAAGICGSDVPRVFTKGTYHFPTVPGHEFAGIIIDTGDPRDKDLLGKRVAVFPLLPCFSCNACKNENYASCSNYDYYGSRRDGAFAEAIVVKKWNLIFIPDNVPTDWAAMTEPCAVAIHALDKAELKLCDSIAIFGAGAIGLIIAMLAREKGAGEILLLDIDKDKLEFANSLGFDYTFCNDSDEYLEDIYRVTNGKGAKICLDAAGVPATIAGCLKAAASSATVVLMGNPSSDINLSQKDYWEILRKQLTIKGTWNSDYGAKKNDWETAISLMGKGILELEKFITHRFPLSDGEKAFKLARDRNEFYVKIMFVNEE